MWKDIKGYEGYYQVNEEGEVKALRRKVKCGQHGGFSIREERIMCKSFSKDGYHMVNLSKDGKNRTTRVHRIVAETFLKRVEGKNEVNHIDCDRTNNKVDNLEWCTHSENLYHSYSKGSLSKKGEKNGRSKLNNENVKSIRNLLNEGFSIKEISKKFNVHSSTIYKVAKGETWGDVKYE